MNPLRWGNAARMRLRPGVSRVSASDCWRCACGAATHAPVPAQPLCSRPVAGLCYLVAQPTAGDQLPVNVVPASGRVRARRAIHPGHRTEFAPATRRTEGAEASDGPGAGLATRTCEGSWARLLRETVTFVVARDRVTSPCHGDSPQIRQNPPWRWRDSKCTLCGTRSGHRGGLTTHNRSDTAPLIRVKSHPPYYVRAYPCVSCRVKCVRNIKGCGWSKLRWVRCMSTPEGRDMTPETGGRWSGGFASGRLPCGLAAQRGKQDGE